jgi:ribosomal protein S4E
MSEQWLADKRSCEEWSACCLLAARYADIFNTFLQLPPIKQVVGGRNAGKVSKIKEIENNRVWLEGEKTFEVPKNLLIVVGKESPLIKLE